MPQNPPQGGGPYLANVSLDPPPSTQPQDGQGGVSPISPEAYQAARGNILTDSRYQEASPEHKAVYLERFHEQFGVPYLQGQLGRPLSAQEIAHYRRKFLEEYGPQAAPPPPPDNRPSEGIAGAVAQAVSPEAYRQATSPQTVQQHQERQRLLREQEVARMNAEAEAWLDPVGTGIQRIANLARYGEADIDPQTASAIELQRHILDRPEADRMPRTYRAVIEQIDPNTEEGRQQLIEAYNNTRRQDAATIRQREAAQGSDPNAPPMTIQQRIIRQMTQPVQVAPNTAPVPGLDFEAYLTAVSGSRTGSVVQSPVGLSPTQAQRQGRVMGREDVFRDVINRFAQDSPDGLNLLLKAGYDVATMGRTGPSGVNEYALAQVDPARLRREHPELWQAAGAWYAQNVVGKEVDYGAATASAEQAVPAQEYLRQTLAGETTGAPELTVAQTAEERGALPQQYLEAGAAELERRMQEEGGVLTEIGSLGTSVQRGSLNAINNTLRGVAVMSNNIQNWMLDENLRPEDRTGLTGWAADATNDMRTAIRAGMPRGRWDMLNTLGEGVGQLAVTMGSGAVGGPALAAAGSSLQMGAGGYDRAIAAGADPRTAGMASLVSYGLGVVDAMPVFKFLGTAQRVAPQLLTYSAVRQALTNPSIVRRIAQQGAEEGATEFVQSVAENLTAQQLYDSTQELLAGSLEEGGYGIVLGGLLGGAMRRANAPEQVIIENAAREGMSPEDYVRTLGETVVRLEEAARANGIVPGESTWEGITRNARQQLMQQNGPQNVTERQVAETATRMAELAVATPEARATERSRQIPAQALGEARMRIRSKDIQEEMWRVNQMAQTWEANQFDSMERAVAESVVQGQGSPDTRLNALREQYGAQRNSNAYKAAVMDFYRTMEPNKWGVYEKMRTQTDVRLAELKNQLNEELNPAANITPPEPEPVVQQPQATATTTAPQEAAATPNLIDDVATSAFAHIGSQGPTDGTAVAANMNQVDLGAGPEGVERALRGSPYFSAVSEKNTDSMGRIVERVMNAGDLVQRQAEVARIVDGANTTVEQWMEAPERRPSATPAAIPAATAPAPTAAPKANYGESATIKTPVFSTNAASYWSPMVEAAQGDLKGLQAIRGVMAAELQSAEAGGVSAIPVDARRSDLKKLDDYIASIEEAEAQAEEEAAEERQPEADNKPEQQPKTQAAPKAPTAPVKTAAQAEKVMLADAVASYTTQTAAFRTQALKVPGATAKAVEAAAEKIYDEKAKKKAQDAYAKAVKAGTEHPNEVGVGAFMQALKAKEFAELAEDLEGLMLEALAPHLGVGATAYFEGADNGANYAAAKALNAHVQGLMPNPVDAGAKAATTYFAGLEAETRELADPIEVAVIDGTDLSPLMAEGGIPTSEERARAIGQLFDTRQMEAALIDAGIEGVSPDAAVAALSAKGKPLAANSPQTRFNAAVREARDRLDSLVAVHRKAQDSSVVARTIPSAKAFAETLKSAQGQQYLAALAQSGQLQAYADTVFGELKTRLGEPEATAYVAQNIGAPYTPNLGAQTEPYSEVAAEVPATVQEAAAESASSGALETPDGRIEAVVDLDKGQRVGKETEPKPVDLEKVEEAFVANLERVAVGETIEAPVDEGAENRATQNAIELGSVLDSRYSGQREAFSLGDVGKPGQKTPHTQQPSGYAEPMARQRARGLQPDIPVGQLVPAEGAEIRHPSKTAEILAEKFHVLSKKMKGNTALSADVQPLDFAKGIKNAKWLGVYRNKYGTVATSELAARLDVDEKGVVAHEIGHWIAALPAKGGGAFIMQGITPQAKADLMHLGTYFPASSLSIKEAKATLAKANPGLQGNDLQAAAERLVAEYQMEEGLANFVMAMAHNSDFARTGGAQNGGTTAFYNHFQDRMAALGKDGKSLLNILSENARAVMEYNGAPELRQQEADAEAHKKGDPVRAAAWKLLRNRSITPRQFVGILQTRTNPVMAFFREELWDKGGTLEKAMQRGEKAKAQRDGIGLPPDITEFNRFRGVGAAVESAFENRLVSPTTGQAYTDGLTGAEVSGRWMTNLMAAYGDTREGIAKTQQLVQMLGKGMQFGHYFRNHAKAESRKSLAAAESAMRGNATDVRKFVAEDRMFSALSPESRQKLGTELLAMEPAQRVAEISRILDDVAAIDPFAGFGDYSRNDPDGFPAWDPKAYAPNSNAGYAQKMASALYDPRSDKSLVRRDGSKMQNFTGRNRTGEENEMLKAAKDQQQRLADLADVKRETGFQASLVLPSGIKAVMSPNGPDQQYGLAAFEKGGKIVSPKDAGYQKALGELATAYPSLGKWLAVHETLRRHVVYFQALLDYRRDAGLVSPELYAELKENKFYLAMFRERPLEVSPFSGFSPQALAIMGEDVAGEELAEGGTAAQRTKMSARPLDPALREQALKKREGGSETTRSFTANAVASTVQAMEADRTNAIYRKMVEADNAINADGGRWFVPLEGRQKPSAGAGFVVYDKGVPTTYAFTEAFPDHLRRSLDLFFTDIPSIRFLGWLRQLNELKKFLITKAPVLSAKFNVYQPVRDNLARIWYSKHYGALKLANPNFYLDLFGYEVKQPVPKLSEAFADPAGFFERVKALRVGKGIGWGEAKQGIIEGGGGQFGYTDTPKAQDKMIADILKSKEGKVFKGQHAFVTGAKLKEITGAFGKGWGKFVQNAEMHARVAEYRAARRAYEQQGMSEYEAGILAASDARELMDFARGGRTAQIMNKYAAFFNATIQGYVKDVRMFKERGAAHLPAFLGKVGLQAWALAELSRLAMDDEDEERWASEPDWVREGFACFGYYNVPGVGLRPVLMPKPFGVARAMMNVAEMTMDSRLGGSKSQWYTLGFEVPEWADQMARNVTPLGIASDLEPAPPILNALVEESFNYDTFRRQRIESREAVANMSARVAEREGLFEGQSSFGRMLGSALDVNPKYVEHFIGELLPKAGPLVLDVLDQFDPTVPDRGERIGRAFQTQIPFLGYDSPMFRGRYATEVNELLTEMGRLRQDRQSAEYRAAFGRLNSVRNEFEDMRRDAQEQYRAALQAGNEADAQAINTTVQRRMEQMAKDLRAMKQEYWDSAD